MRERYRILLTMLGLMGLGVGVAWISRPAGEPKEIQLTQAAPARALPASPQARQPAAKVAAQGVEQPPQVDDGLDRAEPRADADRDDVALREGGSRNRFDRFARYPVLSFAESPRDEQGSFIRSRLLKTEMKYPIVLVRETWTADAKTGADVLAQQETMVGDHIMVALRAGHTELELSELSARHRARIRRRVGRSPVYLIAFEARDTSSLDRMIRSFQSSPIVSAPEPDYIVSN